MYQQPFVPSEVEVCATGSVMRSTSHDFARDERSEVECGVTKSEGWATDPPMPSLQDIHDEYEFLDGDDRYRLLIELGRALEPMPGALKTDATLVRGCSAAVWVYPTRRENGRLHFLADSNAAITKGIIALVLTAVQDRPAAEVADMDVAGALAPFDLSRQLSSNRTQGIPNMIALIRETARRYVS